MTVRSVDRFWAGFLDVDVARLLEPGLTVVAHRRFGDWEGAWVFRRDDACVVMAPARLVERLAEALSPLPVDALQSTDVLATVFGAEFDRTVGPAYQGHLEPRAFRPYRGSKTVRSLDASDAGALEGLRLASEPEEWDAADIHPDAAFGCLADGALVAAASLNDWPPDAMIPGVVTHPAHRGRGYGAAVVSRVVAHALEQGTLALYQTLLENVASVALAKRLGYVQYATHVAVRLKGAPS